MAQDNSFSGKSKDWIPRVGVQSKGVLSQGLLNAMLSGELKVIVGFRPE